MESAKKRLLRHFLENVGKYLTIDELAYVADTHDWQRSVRTLRLNDGYDIEHVKSGPFKGCYILHSLNKSEGKKRGGIDARIKYRILQRDQSRCQRCGRNAADGIRLVIDHKKPVEWGGLTEDDNLWTLCEECNLGKKNWLSDEDSELMKKIMDEKSASKRLKIYFEGNKNMLIDPVKLAVIAGIRDWERTLRSVRQKEKMNIVYIRKGLTSTMEGYMYRV